MAILLESCLVWGAGGHGSVVADLVWATGLSVQGFVDRNPDKFNAFVRSHDAGSVLDESAFLRMVRDGLQLPGNVTMVALGIGDNRTRVAAAHSIAESPLGLPSLVHPAATLSSSARLGLGTVVLANAVINANAAIGQAVIVNSSAVVEHDCVLHDGVHVSPGAVLTGEIEVGPLSWIGAGAVVIPGIRIGSRAVVGAGAVVLHDVPDNTTVAGNPAYVINPNEPLDDA